MQMQTSKEYLTVYAIGSAGYNLIELLWRGFTHWSMGVAGGVGFLLLYLTEVKLAGKGLLKRCLAGCAILTGVELLIGLIVNRAFHMRVWDYSKERGNLFGQICPLYCLLWFLLCIPILPLARLLRRKLHPAAGLCADFSM